MGTVAEGIRIYPDGREVCLDPEVYQARRRQVWLRAGRRCECTEDCSRHEGRRCGQLLALRLRQNSELPVAHIDHIIGRGFGGARRDDRIENLRALCPRCDAIRSRKQHGG